MAGSMSLPAGAATSAQIVVRGASGSQVFSPTVPTSKIKGEGRTAFFKPSALTAPEDTSGGNCSGTNPPTSFAVKNTGTATAYLTVEGGAFAALLAGRTIDVCMFGSSAGATLTLGLTNKRNTKTFAAILTVTASD